MPKILQFKITLKGIKSPIWRRFQVEDTMTFRKLHWVIQNVMGWYNSHIYQFIYEKNHYIGNLELLESMESENIVDDKDLRLSTIFDTPEKQMLYEYDFGDGWMHQLILEKISEKNPQQYYPHCVDGARSCPPEDVGGIGGYENTLEIIKNKRHPEYRETIQWLGGKYDPEYFDLKTVNENLTHYKDIDLDFGI